MERSLQKQEAIVQRSDLVAYSREDFFFHGLIYAASGNVFLQELLEGIAHKARPIGMQITPILFELLRDHRNIVLALRQRDPIRAQSASREHIERMLSLFIPEEEKSSAIPAQVADMVRNGITRLANFPPSMK
jgi:GntR family transcriptional repressor for pyruvate dehydrogenase complex